MTTGIRERAVEASVVAVQVAAGNEHQNGSKKKNPRPFLDSSSSSPVSPTSVMISPKDLSQAFAGTAARSKTTSASVATVDTHCLSSPDDSDHDDDHEEDDQGDHEDVTTSTDVVVATVASAEEEEEEEELDVHKLLAEMDAELDDLIVQTQTTLDKPVFSSSKNKPNPCQLQEQREQETNQLKLDIHRLHDTLETLRLENVSLTQQNQQLQSALELESSVQRRTLPATEEQPPRHTQARSLTVAPDPLPRSNSTKSQWRRFTVTGLSLVGVAVAGAVAGAVVAVVWSGSTSSSGRR